MNKIIKQCPFCGSDNVKDMLMPGYRWGAVRCMQCHTVGPCADSFFCYGDDAEWRRESIDKWNNRVEEQK